MVALIRGEDTTLKKLYRDGPTVRLEPANPAVATIEVTPVLPDAILALARVTPVWMGAMTKVVACYASPFWRDDGLAGAGFSHIGPARELHDMS